MTDIPYFDPESAKATLRRIKPPPKRKAAGDVEGANKKQKGEATEESDDELDSSDEDSGMSSGGWGSEEEEEGDEDMWIHPRVCAGVLLYAQSLMRHSREAGGARVETRAVVRA